VRLADPVDQATGLRRLFTPEPVFRALGVLGPDSRGTVRACVALARGLGRRGGRVMVLDEARPPHHVGGLLGILTRHTLADAVQRGMVDITQPAGDGIVLLSAPNGLETLAEFSEADLHDMADDWHARAEAPEWLVVNGGERGPELGLAATADDRVLVLPGTKTRLADAYAVMKAAHALRAGRTWWVMVDGTDAEHAQALFVSLGETAKRFLGIVPEFLGHLPREKAGSAPPTMDGNRMDRLAGEPAERPGEARVDFVQYWQRMWLHSRMVAESTGKVTATKRVRNVRWSTG
jgi:MinD-like ATPase involved in chromosome partitioning or flagellar assembly